jgi:hypothetical protein
MALRAHLPPYCNGYDIARLQLGVVPDPSFARYFHGPEPKKVLGLSA